MDSSTVHYKYPAFLKSSKPFIATSYDSFVVALITVLILVLITAMYYLYAKPGYLTTGEYWVSVLKTATITFIAGFAYEYGGLNAKYSKDSIQYAKGATLDKYQSRNAAQLAEIAADTEIEELRAAGCEPNPDHIRNANVLRAMAKATRELKYIIAADGVDPAKIYSELVSRYKTKLTRDELNLLLNIHPADNKSRLSAVHHLMELIGPNRELVRYIIRNGFEHIIASPNGRIDLKKLSSAVGFEIKDLGI